MSPIRFFTRRAVSPQSKPVAPTRPVELKPADLKAVSGGGPKGSWADVAASLDGSIDGPKGSW